jgi:hypothetical protein
MPTDISPTTGVEYYSGSWTDIRNVVRTLNIGEGRISKVTQELVNFYQEMIDRQIDGIVNELYHVPLLQFNQCQPDGGIKTMYPGEIVYLSRYWAVGLLVLSEFQGLDPNVTDQANLYMEESKRRLNSIIQYNQRLQGQECKSDISRTMPPSMQMGRLPESEV